MSLHRSLEPRLRLFLALVAASACALSCGASEHAPKDETPEEGALGTLSVSFEEDEQGRHVRFLSVADLTVLHEVEHGGYGAKYDIELQGREEWVSANCNGMRNLIHVGTGTEAAFSRLTASADWWDPRKLAAAGREAGIEIAADGADYWSPASITIKLGTIIATRSRDGDTTMAGGLVYVRSIGENNALDLVIARAPPQPEK